MFEKIIKLFENPSKRTLFQQNEKVYVKFLATQFGGFKESNDPNYYNKIFETLKSHTADNEKIFSQLKHLCYELSEHISKAGDTIHKISAALEGYINEQTAIYKKINFQISEDVHATNKKLLTGVSEWGSQMMIQKKFIIDNMAGFFHYKKHEYGDLGRLIAQQSMVESKYKKRADALEQTKERLWESKTIEKWKLSQNTPKPDINLLLTKYEVAKDYILPEVNSIGDQRS